MRALFKKASIYHAVFGLPAATPGLGCRPRTSGSGADFTVERAVQGGARLPGLGRGKRGSGGEARG